MKGKEAITYLEKHPAGPFPVITWKWIRVKDTNCEFMLLTLEAKKVVLIRCRLKNCCRFANNIQSRAMPAL